MLTLKCDDVSKSDFDWLKKYFREDQIILLGYSLGSSMATYLAKENKPQYLVLVSPFRSMVAMKNLILPVAPSFLMKYPQPVFGLELH